MPFSPAFSFSLLLQRNLLLDLGLILTQDKLISRFSSTRVTVTCSVLFHSFHYLRSTEVWKYYTETFRNKHSVSFARCRAPSSVARSRDVWPVPPGRESSLRPAPPRGPRTLRCSCLAAELGMRPAGVGPSHPPTTRQWPLSVRAGMPPRGPNVPVTGHRKVRSGLALPHAVRLSVRVSHAASLRRVGVLSSRSITGRVSTF